MNLRTPLMARSLVMAAVVAALGVLGAPSRSALAQDPNQVAVLVETADGSLFSGTVPAATEFVVMQGETPRRFTVRDLRMLAISTLRPEDVAALKDNVDRLTKQLSAEDQKERDAAQNSLAAMPGTIAPFLAALQKHSDPEVVVRAQKLLQGLRTKRQLLDPRDLVVVSQGPIRGWLKLDTLDLATSLGPVSLKRDEIRKVRSPDAADDTANPNREEFWPPPMVERPAQRPIDVLVALRSGSQLVGTLPATALNLVDAEGQRMCSDAIVTLVRDTPGKFKVTRRGVPTFVAALAVKELELTCGARRFKIEINAVDTITVGATRAKIGGSSGALATLAQAWLDATANKTELPTQRFWVRINGQSANPWDNRQGTAMTWRLLRVQENLCLVGADDTTNAYQGDTTTEESLPILAVRKRNWPTPAGLKTDQYNGWSGGEVRLTKPVAGTALTSLEVANSIIREEFGDDWEMAEHHHPQGGWHWWAYWADAPETGK